MELISSIIFVTITASMSILLAGLGELIVEKSGVLNLGIEGMMLIGSVCGFVASILSGSLVVGFLAGIISGILMASIFGILSVMLLVNQVAAGLALSIFGVGLSAFIGLNYVGSPLQGLENLNIPYLSDLPFVGKILFSYDIMVYISIFIVIGVYYFLYRSRAGLILTAVGENHHSAYSQGYNVRKIRFLAILFGGAMAGLGGAYLSLVYTPLWGENMTAGKGWIVLALVVFSTWRLTRLLIGTLLFGFAGIMQLFLQDVGGVIENIPIYFFAMTPYIATIAALVAISVFKKNSSNKAPADLGICFNPYK
jgi:simple sugar transport system permease protein